MTQSDLADPLSRAFVSAVEKGQALPSLGTLWLFAARLGIRVGDLVDGVNGIDTDMYTSDHADRHAPPGHPAQPSSNAAGSSLTTARWPDESASACETRASPRA